MNEVAFRHLVGRLKEANRNQPGTDRRADGVRAGPFRLRVGRKHRRGHPGTAEMLTLGRTRGCESITDIKRPGKVRILNGGPSSCRRRRDGLSPDTASTDKDAESPGLFSQVPKWVGNPPARFVIINRRAAGGYLGPHV